MGHLLASAAGSKGEIIGVNVAAEEITERKRAEAALAANDKALRESELRFRELADNISRFALDRRRQWLDLLVQQDRWHGTTQERPSKICEGWDWHDAHHPEHRRSCRRAHSTMLRNRHPMGGYVSSSGQGWRSMVVSVACSADPQRGWRLVRWFGTNTA